MDDVKLGLMSAILNFLRGEFRADYLDPENAEGLEVAIHCLENIFDVSSVRNTPSLLDVYKSYLLTSVSGHFIECISLKIFLTVLKKKSSSFYFFKVLASRDATDAEKAEGERLKVEGNIAMSNGKYTEALEFYSRSEPFFLLLMI